MELRQAEENLQAFLPENREFRSSPTLQLEFDRLNRTVSIRQQLYNGLAQAYKQAKIKEIRDLPVITVVELPEMPTAPDAHDGTRKTLIGIIVGVGIGILIAFGAQLVAVLTRPYGQGTNAISVPSDIGFRFAYGSGSFERHCEEARGLRAHRGA